MIVLVGLPGSGKTTVGRALARRLSVDFLDSDHEIESRIGCPIRVFFEREGEARFRDIESEVLAQLLHSGPTGVLSTGGGAVLRAENRALMHNHGTVLYLSATPEDLYKRLRTDKTRPLLQVADPLKKLRELHQQRDPLYREVAHYVLETGRPSVATLVNMALMQLELDGTHPVAQPQPR